MKIYPENQAQLVHVANQTVPCVALTNAQLRASAVPVSGPVTNAQLRASAVLVAPVGGDMGSILAAIQTLPKAIVRIATGHAKCGTDYERLPEMHAQSAIISNPNRDLTIEVSVDGGEEGFLLPPVQSQRFYGLESLSQISIRCRDESAPFECGWIAERTS